MSAAVSFRSSSPAPWGELQPSPARGRASSALQQQQQQGDLCFVLPDSAQQRQHRHKQLAPGCLLLGRHARRHSTTPPFFASLTAIAQDWRSSSSSSRDSKAGHMQQQHPGVISIGLLQQHKLEDAAAGSTNQEEQEQQAAAVSRKQQQQQQQHARQRQKQHACAAASAPAASSSHAAAAQDEEGEHSSSSTAPPPCRWLDQLGQAKLLVAGAASAVVSRTAMAPLERVKMDLLLKTSSRSALGTALWVLQKEGLGGFWRGNGLNLLRTAPFKALNFASFDVYSKALAGMLPEGNNSVRFIAGAMAGITATLVCFPLDVLRTRLMAPWGLKYGGPLRTLQGVARHEGLGALYAGCVPAVIGMAPSGAIFYGVYDLLKSRHLAELNSSTSSALSTDSSSSSSQQSGQHRQLVLEIPVLYTLLYGALAGAAAETFLYPLEVIRRKMQLQSMAAGASAMQAASAAAAAGGAGGGAAGTAAAAAAAAAPNMLRQHGLKAAAGALVPVGAAAAGALQQQGALGRIAVACSAIVRADGLGGFYAGLLPNMLQVLPSAGLSYGTFETVKHMLGSV